MTTPTAQPQEDTAAPARRRTGRIAAAAALTAAVGVGLIACGQGGHGAAAPDVTVKNAAAARAKQAPAPLKESKPTGLRIPSAGVDASRMLDLGIGADGELEVPPVAKAEVPGWWTGGVTPGQKGAAVLVAHYDTAKGPALMRNVAEVKVGDAIMVPRADGSTATFRVREIQQVDKKDFPTHKVYGATDRPELRLLTCGGPIRNGHRADNIILYADLVR
ncbi:class F sortase [Streptomyces spectabilis]|uniref:LPXTG-site transpeptidase (Sortase) family protein n=2 Tax=Streptomyces spectabilis TaxID=68270 RepID=A0A7W8AV39_STRST|nr:class F sortase [Streptomyces spectabilis]MBB5104556.1 LPXTG-site transpeptidase (sortase) family protein [Streptomyces spectabilis]MCI3905089.1 class F sortase [Streptomyces spectabilis]GGV00729.1 class F sortase [Streptomyces spectabilis]